MTDKIQAKINRLQSQKAVLQNRLDRNTNRKARTRTLIQTGGTQKVVCVGIPLF